MVLAVGVRGRKNYCVSFIDRIVFRKNGGNSL